MKYFGVSFFILLIIISCANDDGIQSEEIDIVEEIEEVGFFNLVVGNQWTYEIFRRVSLDSDEFVTEEVIFTREVINEEIINDETIFTLEQNSNGSSLGIEEGVSTFQVKDSLRFLVRLDQGILFSSVDDNEYLINTLVFEDIFGVLLEEQERIVVPTGDFDCFVNDIFVLQDDGNIAHGRNNELYANEIG